MRRGASEPGEREALAHLDALHGLRAHERRREPGVQPLLLRRVGAEPGRHPAGPHLDHAAHRVPLAARLVDPLLQCLRDDRADTGNAGICPGSAFATAPAATTTAVCRALARSSASRTSSSPYYRSREIGVPGARERDRLRSSLRGSPSGGQGLIPHAQFSWSRFETTSASGVPSVRPWRRPASTSMSCSIRCLGLRP